MCGGGEWEDSNLQGVEIKQHLGRLRVLHACIINDRVPQDLAQDLREGGLYEELVVLEHQLYLDPPDRWLRVITCTFGLQINR